MPKPIIFVIAYLLLVASAFWVFFIQLTGLTEAMIVLAIISVMVGSLILGLVKGNNLVRRFLKVYLLVASVSSLAISVLVFTKGEPVYATLLVLNAIAAFACFYFLRSDEAIAWTT